jgi:predicted acylesterase/phospholipase RssA
MRRAGEGYYSFPPNGQMKLLPGHAFSFWLAILAWLSYLASGAAHQREYFNPDGMKPAWFPTVFHVLIAVLLLSWLIFSLAFFFDRYRVPVVSVLMVGALLSLPSGDTDYVFDLAPAVKVAYPTPNQVLRKKPGPVIVVAAAGGGIQAAAWTAKVLGGLKDTNPEFANAVAAISGVSGGSVGTLHYLTTYPAVRPDPVSACQGFQNATGDSLEGIAWGLVHPDFWRIAFPWAFAHVVDRGWALQRILAKRSGATGLRLSDLAKAIDKGAPAVLINSTMTESGAPMVFASTQFPPPELAAGVYDFHSVYGASDIDLATAVRLSATFPYVSPAARPSAASVPAYHFVDGGYYDNYGMAALIAWLREALLIDDPHGADSEAQRRPILILQIIAFPRGGEPGADRQPWQFQLVAPLLALYTAKDHSQQKRDDFELRLHQEGKQLPNVRVEPFYYNPQHCECKETPPLSWHLTKREIQCIDYAWKDPNLISARDSVARFLHGK